MKSDNRVHHAQITALSILRHATRARYSELRKPTGLESDVFKYHIRKLMSQGLIVKADDGLYELTAEGKEFANRLDERTGREIEQPKASMLLIVRSGDKYLAHRRTREPFYGFWGIASAPMLRGVPIREAAARELKKQTGIVAQFEIAGLQRVIDTRQNGTVLEDKLFTLLLADVAGEPVPHQWYGGESQWLTRTALLANDKLFATTAKTLDMVEHGKQFAEDVCVYANHEY